MAPRVRATTALQETLQAIGGPLASLVTQFGDWKRSFPAGEYESLLFGKDCGYETPLVDGRKNVLWHTHLLPSKHAPELSRWLRDWTRRSRKSSDRALVYTRCDTHGFLLIAILDDPGAHAVAEMRNADDTKRMLRFAKVASAFHHDGSVIA